MDAAASSTAMDPLGLAALGLVALDWLALGWLSGLAWPAPSPPGRVSLPGHVSPSGPSALPRPDGQVAAPRAAAMAATWALRLLVGAFLVAYAQLLLALAGVGFGTTALVLLAAAVLALGLRLAAHRPHLVAANAARRNGHAPASSTAAPASTVAPARRERLGWLLLGGVLLAATVHALLVREAGWDAYSHWGLKALAAAQAGTLVDTGTVHEYYPPLVPLLEAFLYRQRAMASIDLGKDLWPLIGSAFAICLAWHLRLLLTYPQRWLAPYLATGVILGTTQLLEDFATGQADLALCAFLSLASLAALQALREPQQARPWLIQIALFAAAAALTKYEGSPRVAVVVVAVAIEAILARRQARTAADAGVGPVAVAACVCLGLGALVGYAPWLAFEARHGIAPSAEHLSAFQPQTIGAVAGALVAVLAGLRTGGGVLLVVLAAALAGRDALRPPMRLLALIVLGQAAVTLLAFLLSDTAPDIEVRTAATRLIEQFLPLGLVAAGLWLARAAEARAIEAPKPEPIIATTGR